MHQTLPGSIVAISKNAQKVKDWRVRTKLKLIAYKGGKCIVCSYDRCIQALEFHHLDPTQKDFALSGSSVANIEKMKLELDKCVLLCANCHREVHQKLIEV